MSSEKTKRKAKEKPQVELPKAEVRTQPVESQKKLRPKHKRLSRFSTVRLKSGRTSETVSVSQRKCHIHDKVLRNDVENIHESICVKNPRLIKHTDGKYFCLFHLPTKEKNVFEFERLFEIEKNLVENQILAIKDNFCKGLNLAEEEINDIKKNFAGQDNLAKVKIAEIEVRVKAEYVRLKEDLSKLSYDFRYVWFPSKIDFAGYKFEVKANFQGATFSADADFLNSSFLTRAGFNFAVFCAEADFKEAVFGLEADFECTEFLETSQIYFVRTKFLTKANFRRAMFAGYLIFEGTNNVSVFLEKPVVRKESVNLLNEKKREFRMRGIEKRLLDVFINEGEYSQNPESALDLQNARLEKPERITFRSVRLRPNWFVNTNASKFVFTNCTWKVDSKDVETTTELSAIAGRKIPNAHNLLTKACWQLADNHEDTKSFPHASMFRQISFNSERLQRKEKFKTLCKEVFHLFTKKRRHKKMRSIMSARTKRFFNLWKTSRLDSVHFLYRWLSGYGENWKWAFAIVCATILFFGVLYMSSLTTFDYGEKKPKDVFMPRNIPEDKPQDAVEAQIFEVAAFGERFHSMEPGEAIVYSLFVSALQRPEPKAADDLTKSFVIGETIFVPVQLALLALAIRRKFMR